MAALRKSMVVVAVIRMVLGHVLGLTDVIGIYRVRAEYLQRFV
jgi:hypothetical protein